MAVAKKSVNGLAKSAWSCIYQWTPQNGRGNHGDREMVLNKVNKSLVTLVQELGVNAVGISGKDGGLLKVEKKYSNGEDIGFVGEITEVNPQILYEFCWKRIFSRSSVR